MRKIKKINGFLVVKFNDREKREYEGTALGEYGVIDAEVYTGNLDIDRGAMEYDDADTLEVAVELARGLESEEDITDEPPTYTAAVETNESYTEEAVEPTALIEGWTRRLATQVKSKHHPDTDPRTAAHELYGFKMALHQIGFLPESEVITDPDTFGAGRLDGPMPRNPEELLAFVCDERCKNRAGHTQEELDAICAKCPLGQLYEDAEAQDLRIRERSERALQEHIEGVRRAEDTVTALLGGHEALAYEDTVGWSAIEAGYKTVLRGSRKFTREAVLYDLYSEVNNVRLWRDLKKIEKTRQAGVSEYTPGKYRHRIIMEPKERSLHIPPLRDKVVQLVIHQELQTLFRPVFVNRSFACMYGKGPIRAAFNVQHDMRVARMKWGDEATVIKIDVRKFFYSTDRSVLKQIIAKRFKKLKKKYPEKYEDFLRFYRLLCKVIDSSPEGERGIPLGNVSSQDFANIYLNELDQFCIRFLGATLYTRYMDDVVVIAPNKEIAREWLAKIKVFLQERLHLETNQKTKIFYVRQGVNAYGFKIKATHLLLRTESKRREKRRIKRMMEKLQEGTITKAAIVQSVNSWLGFARWACAYNLAKKIFAPYRFIKTEGEIPYGAISRNRQARRILQQRRNSQAAHKAVAA